MKEFVHRRIHVLSRWLKDRVRKEHRSSELRRKVQFSHLHSSFFFHPQVAYVFRSERHYKALHRFHLLRYNTILRF